MARGGGRTRQNTWDRCSNDLVARQCPWRLRRRADRPWIYVLHYDGAARRAFSTEHFQSSSDADIEHVYRLCLKAQELGHWPGHNGPAEPDMAWSSFAAAVQRNVQERIPRQASRAHTEGHLRTIATFTGSVTAARLERWARELDPIAQASPFRKRLETLAQIQTSGLLDLRESLVRLKALRPKGSAKRRQEQRVQRPRAIPTDQELQAWLDRLQGVEQWAFALVATYGLRPSEAWHAEGIDDDGWIAIPGDGLTKTARHYAPPVPASWVSRYCLAERFSQYQGELRSRWPIRWEERDGMRVPVNNSAVANYLYKQFQLRGTPKLWTQACDHADQEWVRPYDLRHAYAIRCFSDTSVAAATTEQHAAWLGHGREVHERIYLRWLPATRQAQALKAQLRLASGHQAAQEAPRGPSVAQSDTPPVLGVPEAPVTLPADVLARLAKLERLEQLLQS